jgi:hypothetical protein
MKLQNIKKSTWGLIIFSISALIGIIFSGASVWGNIEAFLFNPGLRADENIKTMKCPVLITNSETGTITAAFTNPGDRPVMTTVRTSISDGLFLMIRETDTRIQLEAGETKELEWTVSPEDAAWERLIFVRVYSLRSTPLPARNRDLRDSCGKPALSYRQPGHRDCVYSQHCWHGRWFGVMGVNQPTTIKAQPLCSQDTGSVSCPHNCRAYPWFSWMVVYRRPFTCFHRVAGRRHNHILPSRLRKRRIPVILSKDPPFLYGFYQAGIVYWFNECGLPARDKSG